MSNSGSPSVESYSVSHSMENNVVLGFDSWVGGVHNFQRLHAALQEKGLELRLLHIGSWGGDPGRPSEETIDGMLVRDISYYGGMDVFKILHTENPKGVLFLSNDVFAHRAVNRYCKFLGIPTVHLYHGLVGIQSIEKNTLYKINPIRQFFYVVERIPKALRYIWPLYAKSLLRTRAQFTEWLRFVTDIVRLTAGRYIPVAASDSLTSGCCIYTEADAIHATSKYGYTRKQIYVVGNPDISRFGLTEQKIGIGLDAERFTDNNIIYIDTGLVYAGMVFTSADDFLDHLVKLQLDLKQQNLTLSVKLHPDHFRTDLPARISHMGIKVLQNEEFTEALSTCTAAIVEPSTAALIPALIGIPVFLASFGKLLGQQYGGVLLSYPRCIPLLDPVRLKQALFERAAVDIAATQKWIQNNCGPLPAEKMPTRVADVLIKIIGH